MKTKLEQYVERRVLNHQGFDAKDHGAMGLLVMQVKHHRSGFIHAIEVLQELLSGCDILEHQGVAAAIKALQAYALEEESC